MLMATSFMWASHSTDTSQLNTPSYQAGRDAVPMLQVHRGHMEQLEKLGIQLRKPSFIGPQYSLQMAPINHSSEASQAGHFDE